MGGDAKYCVSTYHWSKNYPNKIYFDFKNNSLYLRN